jgi:replicative DNA helicase
MYESAEESLRLIKSGAKSDEIAAAIEQYSNNGYSRQKGVVIGDAASRVAEKAKELAKSGLAFSGIPTGYQELDNHIGGLCNGHLILLAGFTNMGKSAFAIQLCHNALRSGARCGYISMELSASDIAERMIALSGEISIDELRTIGNLPDHRMKALDSVVSAMSTMPLTILDRPTWSMHEVRAEARRLVRKGCDLLVIDLLGKVHVDTKKQDSRARELELVAAHTKALGKELDIPILGCVQLNRQSVYDQQAELHHLKDSNGLAENADEVLILDRRNPKLNDCKLYIKVRKSRRGSNAADIPFRFNPKHQTFKFDPPEAI